MQVFISYASEDRRYAEQIHLALEGKGPEGRGVRTFFDAKGLDPGGEFHERIEAAFNASDLFVFLVSPDSIKKDRYTLTELEYAKHRWRHPEGRVLPVMVRPVEKEKVDPYLLSVTILSPKGSLVAEVRKRVLAMAHDLKRDRRRQIATRGGLGALIAAICLIVILFFRSEEIPSPGQNSPQPKASKEFSPDKRAKQPNPDPGSRKVLPSNQPITPADSKTRPIPDHPASRLPSNPATALAQSKPPTIPVKVVHNANLQEAKWYWDNTLTPPNDSTMNFSDFRVAAGAHQLKVVLPEATCKIAVEVTAPEQELNIRCPM